MGVLEILGGILLVLSSIVLILLVLMQDSKQQNTGVLTGSSSDSYYNKNQTKTKDMILAKITRVVAVIFFAVIVGVNIFTIFIK